MISTKKLVLFLFALILNSSHILAKKHSKCGEPHMSIPGGTSPMCDDQTLGEFEAHAKKAVSQLQHSDGSTCTYKDFEEPTSQVVSGMLYRATVHHDCGGQSKKCELKVWSQPWLGSDKLSWECDEYKNHKISKRDCELVIIDGEMKCIAPKPQPPKCEEKVIEKPNGEKQTVIECTETIY